MRGDILIPDIKYYVISIAAIFLALGIGIYIGFTLDAHNLLIEQKDDMVTKIEEKLDYLNNENNNLKKDIDELNKKNDQYQDYAEDVYSFVIKDRLDDVNIAIVETNDDYVYSGIGKTLELAGANVVNITTITDKFLNEELLKNICANSSKESNTKGNVIEKGIVELTRGLIEGKNTDFIQKLKENEIINIVGDYDKPVDFIIIAGGSEDKNLNRISKIDKNIVNIAKKSDIPIIGIEKEKVTYSYIKDYKNLRISTVDNVDSVIGKTALIFSMEGRPGNYGVKSEAEELLPSISNNISE